MFVSMAATAGTQDGIEAFRKGKLAKAESALRPEAEKGDRVAQFYLAKTLDLQMRGMLGARVAKPGDPRQQEAHAWIEKSARQGYEAAWLDCSRDFDDGYGTEPDFPAALEWMQKAAGTGDPMAMLFLQFWYEEGHIVAPDHEKANALREKRPAASPAAAKTQSPFDGILPSSGPLALGVDEERDCAKFTRWAERADNSGDADVNLEMGRHFYVGDCGKQDFARARTLLSKAAEASDLIEPHDMLATMKLFGHGQAPDYAGAYVHLRIVSKLDSERAEDVAAMLRHARRQLTPAQLAAAEAEISKRVPGR